MVEIISQSIEVLILCTKANDRSSLHMRLLSKPIISSELIANMAYLLKKLETVAERMPYYSKIIA